MIDRKLTLHIKKMLNKFPVVSVTGPRQSGKTTMLKAAFPDYHYYNLERIDYRELILSDIVGFLRNAGPYVIFDEAQNIPELFSYIQVISDERNIPGQYILSGSQSFLLNKHISQSLAGRVSVNNLFPFDITEYSYLKEQNLFQTILNGFYPRIYDQKIDAKDFYPSYLQTYIERDVRTLKAIENLNTFTRFLGLCAGRVGQILNISSLANDAGVAVNTAKAWLSLLESSYIIYLLKPYHKNFNKRIIKAPKLYFYDTGVVSSLLKLTDPNMIKNHYAYGSLFENLVISEIIKSQNHLGIHPEVYYWRESNGCEIDCIVDKGNNHLLALEIKGGETFNSDFVKNLKKFTPIETNTIIDKALLYTGDTSIDLTDIKVINWNSFPSMLEKLI